MSFYLSNRFNNSLNSTRTNNNNSLFNYYMSFNNKNKNNFYNTTNNIYSNNSLNDTNEEFMKLNTNIEILKHKLNNFNNILMPNNYESIFNKKLLLQKNNNKTFNNINYKKDILKLLIMNIFLII